MTDDRARLPAISDALRPLVTPNGHQNSKALREAHRFEPH
jgi:hypothetical protein